MGERKLKPYKGYEITKVAKDRYISSDRTDGMFEASSLKELKKRIDAKISVHGLRKTLGRLLLAPR